MAQQPCSVQGGLQSLNKGTCFSKAEVVELVLRWKSKEPPVQLTKSPPRCPQQRADARHSSSPQRQDFQGTRHGKRCSGNTLDTYLWCFSHKMSCFSSHPLWELWFRGRMF